jgi:transposase-like protein
MKKLKGRDLFRFALKYVAVMDQASEIARLRQENERLRMERDILKKSIAIFAGTRT